MKILTIKSKKWGIHQILYDDIHENLVSQYNWHIIYGYRNSFYASSHYWDNLGNRHSIELHRLIMGCHRGDGKIIDHIDRNGLNNQISNLRFATKGLNRFNSYPNKNTVTGEKNICTRNGRYYVKIMRKHVGVYGTLKEAISARDIKSKSIENIWLHLQSL